jgi:gamma-glutamylcyclotransferase (GGCT)/AIG2-like uncharacterized protein YtfP
MVDGETLLFVYGTLKRGLANHGRLQGARPLGDAVLTRARLYDLGPFPMAVAGDGQVGGELYAVAWSALPALDAFEGCPRLYQRHWLSLADGRQAWAYLGQARQVRHSPWLREGIWPAVAPSSPARASGLRRLAGGAVVLGSLFGGAVAFAGGFDTEGTCQAWRRSHGPARVALANAIGEANFLTKHHPFADSSSAQPVALYDSGDIRRVCDLRGR